MSSCPGPSGRRAPSSETSAATLPARLLREQRQALFVGEDLFGHFSSSDFSGGV
jgi:hypothetical protein